MDESVILGLVEVDLLSAVVLAKLREELEHIEPVKVGEVLTECS